MKKIIYLLFINMFAYAAFAQKVERIEPSNWWIGMQDPFVQVMLYGENISQFEPKVKYKGFKLREVHRVENPNYLFLDFEISGSAKAGSVSIKLDEQTEVPFELRLRKNNSANRQGFNSSDVIYLITPDRFVNGDVANDNIESYLDKLKPHEEFGRHGGDIKGIIDHLDYIEEMGFTAIWPMPMDENNMDEVSYHGYSITDYYKVDPRYGSNHDYITLAAEAKKRGIKLIKDVVLNHCGLNHWWMKDLPSADWINNGGKFMGTNHRRETHQDIHSSDYDTRIFSDGWFVPSMPDLNQRNPFMANYLIQNGIWWIETADLGGYRVDTYPYSDPAFLSRWSKRIMDEYPSFNITSEEWTNNTNIAAYWQKGKINSNGYESHVPSPMDFSLQNALISGLKEKEAYDKGLIKIYQSLSNDFVYADASQLLVFADNHDMSRIYTQLDEDFELFKMAIAYLATTRGIPQFYYGTEILMANPKSDSHGEIRGDFPGGNWGAEKTNGFTAEGLSEKEKEAQGFFKKLLNYRKGNPVLHNGHLIHFAPEDGFYVYFRKDASKKLMVILNKNEIPKTLYLGRFREILPENTAVLNVMNNENLTLGEELRVDPKSVLILELK